MREMRIFLILYIVYSLIHLDKGFKDLLRAIDYYNKYKNSIVKQWQNNEKLLSDIEIKELKRYSDAIYRRLEYINFKTSIKRWHKHLKGKFPTHKFPTPNLLKNKI